MESLSVTLRKTIGTLSEKTNGRCERFHDRELPPPTQIPIMESNQEATTHLFWWRVWRSLDRTGFHVLLEIFLPNPLWFILYCFGREYSLPGCFPLLVSELAAVFPCRENAQSVHWFSQIMFLWSFSEWRSDFPSKPLFIFTTINKWTISISDRAITYKKAKQRSMMQTWVSQIEE